MAPAGDEGGTVAEAQEHPASFDPASETGQPHRGPRSHELDPEVGAAPFDPGPDHYDGRRAKRAERRREKAERKRREKAERRERERKEAAQAERHARVHAQQERRERARNEREAAAAAKLERERRAGLERDRAEEERGAELERAARQKREREERRAVEREGRERAEAERRAEKERVRAERDATEQQQKLERQRERRGREERERAERKLAKRRRRERKQGRGRPKRRRRAGKSKPAAAGKRVATAPGPAAERPAQATPRPKQEARPKAPAHRPAADAQRASLKRPTAKAAVALAAVVAVAVGAGVLLGLPLPLVGNSDGPDASLAGTAPVATLDPGTPIGLTKGPYHPVVVSNPDYGEAAAKFGADRGGRRHEGQDVFARPRTPLVAVRDGIVVDGGGGKSFYSYGGGNTLAIYSPLDDRSYIYLHMLRPALVRAGEQVKAGQLVGYVGCTGSCDGPHLHFEVRRGRAVFGPQKKAFDPLPLLRQWPMRPVDDGK